MTQGTPPGPPPSTPGSGESNQGYGPTAGQPGAGYGAPAYGAPGSDPYATPTRREDTVGVVGLIIAAIGAALLLVSFLVVDWFSARLGHLDFSELHDGATSGDAGDTWIFKAYFNWLGWALLAVVIVVALAANLPTPVSPALRGLGALVGLAGAAVTFWAIKIPDVGYSDVLKETRLGFYFAAGGFLIAGIGAVIGPQRR
jgi:hypothetical protein